MLLNSVALIVLLVLFFGLVCYLVVYGCLLLLCILLFTCCLLC